MVVSCRRLKNASRTDFVHSTPISSPNPDMHARGRRHSFQPKSRHACTRTKAFLSSLALMMHYYGAWNPDDFQFPIFFFCCSRLSFRILFAHSFRCNFKKALSMAAPTQSLTPSQSHAAIQALLNGPAVLPPAGVLSNFENPPKNLFSVFLAIAALTLSFATVAVVIRVYTKRCLIRSIGYEDCRS